MNTATLFQTAGATVRRTDELRVRRFALALLGASLLAFAANADQISGLPSV